MRDTEKDAARYRWLIEGDNLWRAFRFTPVDMSEVVGETLERAIDAAMQQDACTVLTSVYTPPNV